MLPAVTGVLFWSEEQYYELLLSSYPRECAFAACMHTYMRSKLALNNAATACFVVCLVALPAAAIFYFSFAKTIGDLPIAVTGTRGEV